jgi:hypothetical protein
MNAFCTRDGALWFTLLAACHCDGSSRRREEVHVVESAVPSSSAVPDAAETSVTRSHGDEPLSRPIATSIESISRCGMRGPFVSVAQYCAWFSKDCVPGDARLCVCKLAPAVVGADAVAWVGRDLGRGTDSTYWRPAIRIPGGMFVARKGTREGPPYDNSAGVGHEDVKLDEARRLNRSDVSHLFVFSRHIFSAYQGRRKESTEHDVVMCGRIPRPWCSEPLTVSEGSARLDFRAEPAGSFTIEGDLDGHGAQLVRRLSDEILAPAEDAGGGPCSED